MRGGKFDKLDQALYVWFRQMRGKGVPVTGPILFEKANEYHAILYADSPKSSTASYSFQWRFCNRFGIVYRFVGKNSLLSWYPLTNSYKILPSWRMVTPETRYSRVTKRDCIIKCDKIDKMLPGRKLTTVHNDPTGPKKAKERITINAWATGTIKLPLLFRGKYNNPRCFRGIKKQWPCFEKCLSWLLHQTEATVGNTSTLVTFRELGAEKREATRKQSDIRSFFS